MRLDTNPMSRQFETQQFLIKVKTMITTNWIEIYLDDSMLLGNKIVSELFRFHTLQPELYF